MESPPPKKKFLYNLCTTTVPCHRAYTIMVLNQKMPERKNWSQSIHYNLVLNQKMPERKNWSRNIHYNGSKPEITRKKKLVTEHTL